MAENGLIVGDRCEFSGAIAWGVAEQYRLGRCGAISLIAVNKFVFGRSPKSLIPNYQDIGSSNIVELLAEL